MGVPWNDIAKGRGYANVGQMMRAMYPKFTLQALSARFGCSVDAVRRQLEKENIPLRARGGALITPKLDKITEEDFKTKTAKEISQEHGVDITSVYKFMKRKGITPPSVVKRRAILEENEKARGVEVEDLEGTLNEMLKSDPTSRE
jgi:coenzyme F420-reducing hydrogenase beta subunit